MKDIIYSALFPNFEKDDVNLCFRLLFSSLKKGESIKDLEIAFKNKFKFNECYSFNSGRSCLMAILEAMGIKKGDEIIVQGFTCNAVINPIINIGAKPIYVDLKDDLNIDEKKIQQSINSKTKAVIVQHTFGWPAEIEEIRDICRDNNLFLIEDCAHSLGAKYNNQYVGSFGDASFFSFGRDKIISSVFGGMIVINNPLLKIKEYDFPSNLWTINQLLYPILMQYVFLPLFRFRIGRIFYSLMFELNIFSLRSVDKKENQGILPRYFGKRMPNALASLALNQLNKLDRLNTKRREIAKAYFSYFKNSKVKVVFREEFNNKSPVFLKFPVLVDNPDKILRDLRKENIFINDGWRETVIVPPLTNQEKMEYNKGQCLLSEKISKNIISLPTHAKLTIEDVKKIASVVKK
ncbi:MAG TPA: aminotransferase class V-fold PLP-dependent enzyme [Candidatus Pacearchaeota archaeon]|nr:aminotransferase class V-fold PLP-dependent enzyme [Candidatus Parcubacteria bacterium]HOC53463.1 aminotransferase class V-fold PLP-dependent enzyme [Candidatus Pacearchaeota archaeon]HQM24289.1 aminotransferase class V-fold PLP-dependent enzyme [Candidatus Pacearchaeota archaeon]